MPSPATQPQRSKQLRLFTLRDPLTERLGADYFRSLPRQPGVYFFYGAHGELLYIGQSLDLRARIGSYRHVAQENHQRRTLRLIHRVVKIEWKQCATQEEAIELERTLLLEHRPPFNRAGVWKGSPWWLKIEVTQDRLNLALVREEDEHGIGPLPSSFRYVLGRLVRCLYRTAYPDLPISEYPHGLFDPGVPLTLSLALPDVQETAELLREFTTGNSEPLLSRLETMPPSASEAQQKFWQEELDRLRKHVAKARKRDRSPSPS